MWVRVADTFTFRSETHQFKMIIYHLFVGAFKHNVLSFAFFFFSNIVLAPVVIVNVYIHSSLFYLYKIESLAIRKSINFILHCFSCILFSASSSCGCRHRRGRAGRNEEITDGETTISIANKYNDCARSRPLVARSKAIAAKNWLPIHHHWVNNGGRAYCTPAAASITKIKQLTNFPFHNV